MNTVAHGVSLEDVMADSAAMDSFWSRVKKDEDPIGCWVWTGPRVPDDYGVFSHRGKVLRAHRLAYRSKFGPIQDGMFVCHHCDNPPCVNPAHLFLGTHKENMRDMVAKGRAHRKVVPEGSQQGGKHYRAILKDCQVVAIRSGAYGGTATRDLARMFGVAYSTMRHIRNGSSWKHIPLGATVPNERGD